MKFIKTSMKNLQMGEVPSKVREILINMPPTVLLWIQASLIKEQIDQMLKLLKTNSSSSNPSVSLAQSSNCSQALT